MSTVVTNHYTVAERQYPAVRWSAIFCGWLVAMGIAWLMYVLGLAAGFSAIDATDANVGKGLGIGTGVWLLLTWAVSLFLGGMFASWFDGKRDPVVGTLHGVAVWALAITASAILAFMGFTNVLQGGASILKGAATMGASAAGAAGAAASKAGNDAPDPGMGMLQAEVKQQIAEAVVRNANGMTTAQAQQPTVQAQAAQDASTGANAPANANAQAAPKANEQKLDTAEVREAMENIDSAAVAAVSMDLVRGNKERATQRLALETGLQPAQLEQVTQTLNAKVEEYKASAKEAADKTAKYTAAAMWAAFVAALVALIAAALGGWMGARNVHRVYDYEVVA